GLEEGERSRWRERWSGVRGRGAASGARVALSMNGRDVEPGGFDVNRFCGPCAPGSDLHPAIAALPPSLAVGMAHPEPPWMDSRRSAKAVYIEASATAAPRSVHGQGDRVRTEAPSGDRK